MQNNPSIRNFNNPPIPIPPFLLRNPNKLLITHIRPRQIQPHHIRFLAQPLLRPSTEFYPEILQQFRPCIISSERRSIQEVLIERHSCRSRQKTHLPHSTAESFAEMSRAGNHVFEMREEDRATWGAEGFGKAEGYGVDERAVVAE